MKKELRKGLRTWIEIDRKAIKNNFNAFRSIIPKKCKLLAVVKSNAYGHNLIEFAKEQEKLGADYIGVDSIVEALTLRKEGIKAPILVLGYTLPEMIEEAIRNDISIAVSSFETLKEIKKIIDSPEKILTDGKSKIFRASDKKSDASVKTLTGKIHIKVDTGMGRHGFLLPDKEKVINELKKIININVEGLFTHFSSAKDSVNRKYTENQIENFKKWKEVFYNAGFEPICHACATSGTILYPSPIKVLTDGKSKIFRASDKISDASVKILEGGAHFDMVRIGIGLYGIWPSKETRKYAENKLKLIPVLSWKTLVGELKELPKGSKVGYDGTATLKRNSKVAICPIGYWHGYPRALSNIGEVLVNGKIAKLLGRVCMDIIMIDVTDVKSFDKNHQDLRGAKVGDEVVIIGKSGTKEITADSIADKINGSVYELLTRINPLIKKIYK